MCASDRDFVRVFVFVCVCVCFQCACSFTVHRNELRLQVLILNTCAFLYVYECTFVPKNLDRVRGH